MLGDESTYSYTEAPAFTDGFTDGTYPSIHAPRQMTVGSEKYVTLCDAWRLRHPSYGPMEEYTLEKPVLLTRSSSSTKAAPVDDLIQQQQVRLERPLRRGNVTV